MKKEDKNKFIEPKIILVTGCAGFIASNFIKTFKKEFPKTKIIGIDDMSTGHKELLNKEITFYRGSICDLKIINKIFLENKIEYIFHFGALPSVSFSVEHPAYTSEININGTIILLEKAHEHKIKRFIFSSSSAIYGLSKKLPTTEKKSDPKPQSPYALQKYTSEMYCKMFSKLFNIDTVCLRYFNVFGAGQYGNSAYSTVISAWLEALYFPNNKTLFIEGDGKQSRDFCHVDNVVYANIQAMKSNNQFNGDCFNIATSTKINLLEIKKYIELYTGKKLNLEKRPPRLGDIKHTFANIQKAKKYLRYKPITNFEEGLQKTIIWFENRKN